ncbi:MAG: Omp28-related outer membrane protein [Alistipes sp.]|nr:Omp28-related outer membrane protein [Alistipes sp.]
MKQILFSIVALFALLFGSCELLPTDEGNNNNNTEVGDQFRVVSGSYIEMPAEGGNAEIEYVIDTEVEGAKLTASSATEWIKDIKVNDTVTFTVEANTTITDRLGSITLSYDNTTVAVAVDQLGREVNNDAVLTVTSDRTLNFSDKGGEGTITYTLTGANEGDEPIVTTDDEWIKNIVIESDKVNFFVEENNTTSLRRGSVVLTYGSYTFTTQIKQEAQSGTPKLNANKANIKLGESVSFTVTFANTDVTSSSTIYDYYTKAEVSNPYTPTEVAERVFFAKYNGTSSNVFTVTVVPSDTPDLPADSNPESYDFNQRILLVSHTGAGCGYCPPAKQAFKDAEENVYYKDKFNTVYSYSFNSMEACYSSAARTLWNYYVNVCKTGDQLTGYPSFTTNFCFNYTGKTNITNRIDEFWDKNVSASVALATKRDGNKLVVNAAVKSKKDQNIKIALWLLEDDVYATQSSASASWMHTHHNVMRDGITGLSSTDISGVDFGYVNAYTTYERVMDLELFIGSSWNINNCKLIAIISAPNSKYDGKYEVVNTAICEIGGSVGFDYKK